MWFTFFLFGEMPKIQQKVSWMLLFRFSSDSLRNNFLSKILSEKYFCDGWVHFSMLGSVWIVFLLSILSTILQNRFLIVLNQTLLIGVKIFMYVGQLKSKETNMWFRLMPYLFRTVVMRMVMFVVVVVAAGRFISSMQNASRNRWFFVRSWSCEGDRPKIRFPCTSSCGTETNCRPGAGNCWRWSSEWQPWNYLCDHATTRVRLPSFQQRMDPLALLLPLPSVLRCPLQLLLR